MARIADEANERMNNPPTVQLLRPRLTPRSAVKEGPSMAPHETDQSDPIVGPIAIRLVGVAPRSKPSNL